MPAKHAIMTLWTLSLGAPLLMAQEMNGPLVGPTTAVTPRAETTAAVVPDGAAVPETQLEPGAGPDTKAMSNRLPVQLGLTLAGYYDDNLFIRPGPDKVGDFVYDVAPFISWNSAQNTGLDNSVQLTYSPGFIFYQNHPGFDTFEDTGSFVYALHGARSDLTVTQQYASVQNSAPDEGDLVKSQQYLTTINFDYTLTAKFSLTLHAEQEFIDYDEGFSSKQWMGSAYVNYELMPKTTVGLGGAAGAVDLEGPNQVFEQVNGRVTYSPTDKLKFIATAGGEFRQTEGSSTTTVTPVFSGSLTYEPWDDTELTGEVYRRYDYSAKFFGQDYIATGFSTTLTQTFFQKLRASLAATYENARYVDNLNDEESDLNYNYFTARPALDYQLTTWCQLGVFYQYRQNISRELGSFVDQQFGLQARFTY